jgi:hypothetical protein
MYVTHIANHPYVSSGFSNAGHFGKAVKAFFGELLATSHMGVERHPVDPEAVNAAGIDDLYALASHFEQFMPNQAAELRYLASHDQGALSTQQ